MAVSIDEENVQKRSEWIQQGWSRGAFVNLKSRKDIINELPAKLVAHVEELEVAYLFPTLYDCALINPNPESEPWVQCIICWPCEVNEQYTHVKDSRRYHFNIMVAGIEKSMEVTALSFCQLDKSILLSGSPEKDILWVEHGLDKMLNWVTNRYDQPTFPDAFNKRMSKAKSNFKSLSRNEDFNKNCPGIYINIVPFQELEDEQEYEVSVFVTLIDMEGRDLMNFQNKIEPMILDRLHGIFVKLGKNGVKLSNLDTIPEKEFTKYLERNYKRWSLENFSYAEERFEAPLPAEKSYID